MTYDIYIEVVQAVCMSQTSLTWARPFTCE